MNDQQLIDLETKISYHENAIEILQKTAYEQQKIIEKLEAKFSKLTQYVEGVLADGRDSTPGNEKPPHY